MLIATSQEEQSRQMPPVCTDVPDAACPWHCTLAFKSWLVHLAGKAFYAMQKFKLYMKLNISPDLCLLDGSPCMFMFLAHLLLKTQGFTLQSLDMV